MWTDRQTGIKPKIHSGYNGRGLIIMIIIILLGSSPDTDTLVSNEEVDIIFGSPEVLVGNAQRREKIQTLTPSMTDTHFYAS
jgi:hypothetical protein